MGMKAEDVLGFTMGYVEQTLQGAGALRGEKGDDGKSAYQYAQDGGYIGTETEFTTNIARSGVISKELEVELIDGRTDYTGKTWDNIGSHIREITSMLYNTMAYFVGDLPSLYKENFALKDLSKNGWYRSGGIDPNMITDLPPGFNKTKGFSILSIIDNTNGKIQTIQNYGDSMYYRYVNSAGEETDWVTISTKDVFSLKSTIKTLVGENETFELSSISESGWYLSGGVDITKISDMPPEFYGRAFHFMNFCFESTVKTQIMFDVNDFGFFYRFINKSVDYGWKTLQCNSPKTKWIAFGDSISLGCVSLDDGSYTYVDGKGAIQLTNQWFLHRDLENKSLGGNGYVRELNGSNVTTQIDNADLTDVDLVTIWAGINDWRYDMPLGDENSTVKDGTICGNLRYCIEQITTRNKNARLVIISPINQTYTGTTIQTRYALDFEKTNSKSLKKVAEMIKYWCDYYCVDFVDMTNTNSGININNISDILLDGLHPSQSGHNQLARALGKLIPYK